ncbi:hypothetical protein [Streptomyces sp. NBC_00859]|uniref:hypothetical protein n=1 Tax=Streptomyces sp. NBC_00859 TaxID=2903682 RepID=UPI0038677EBF|nr:hypothetical protein OG584_00065 [Streptomyces sp. NBC_00859]WSZ86782.1 hypothetical protein OG584_35070 [Streptomyces sp. NBC_00859]
MSRYSIDVVQSFRSTGFLVGKTQTPNGFTFTVTDSETGRIIKSGHAFTHKQAVAAANKVVTNLNAVGTAKAPKGGSGKNLTALDPTGMARNLRRNADMYESKGKGRKAAKLRAKADALEQEDSSD